MWAYLLHLSTDFIFDGAAGPYDEQAEPNPLSFYGHSKLDAEFIVRQEPGLSWGIARTILVYGLAQDMSRSNIILWVKSSLEQGKKIQVVDDQWRTPTPGRRPGRRLHPHGAGQGAGHLQPRRARPADPLRDGHRHRRLL